MKNEKYIDIYETTLTAENVNYIFRHLLLFTVISKNYNKYQDFEKKYNDLYTILKKIISIYYQHKDLKKIEFSILENFKLTLDSIKNECIFIESSYVNNIIIWYDELIKMWEFANLNIEVNKYDIIKINEVYETIPQIENIQYMFQRLFLPIIISIDYEPYKDYQNDYTKLSNYVEKWINIYFNTNDLTNISSNDLDNFEDILAELGAYCLRIDTRYIEEIDIWFGELLELWKKSYNKEMEKL